MDKIIISFTIITFINVMLSTIKSILTVRASRGVAAIINAISYGFYAMVVKQMTTVDLEIVVIVTVICNLVGVYLSMWVLDKFKKEELWKITVIPQTQYIDNIKTSLIEANIGFNEYPINTHFGNVKPKYSSKLALDIFSQSRETSELIKEILKENGKYKYHIQEIGRKL